MSAYILAQIQIHDPVRYRDYTSAFRAQFRDFPGEVLAGDENAIALEGDWPWSKTVILRFETREIARDWYNSAAYQAAAEHRRASSVSNLALVSGEWAGRSEAEAALIPG